VAVRKLEDAWFAADTEKPHAMFEVDRLRAEAEFIQRLQDASTEVRPFSGDAAALLADGPEVSGSPDLSPDSPDSDEGTAGTVPA
jgi:hypothetical protein